VKKNIYSFGQFGNAKPVLEMKKKMQLP